MENALQILFIGGFGFIASAIVSFGSGMFTGEGSYKLSFASTGSIVFGFVVCMFAGPYLTLEKSLAAWRTGGMSGGILLSAFAIAALWSFCAGVLVSQLLVSMSLI